MRKILAVFLSFVLLLSSTVVSFASDETEATYGFVNVEYSDQVGSDEILNVMVKNSHVYVNAEQLCTRLGYQIDTSSADYVTIFNEANNNLPNISTQFFYNDNKVNRKLNFKNLDGYEAPFPSFHNEQGVWIPFGYSLLVLNSNMLILDDTILIDMPKKNILDICLEIMKNASSYLFDWAKDFGYTELDVNLIGGSSYFVNVLNGLLKMDSDSWIQLMQSLVLDSSSYDSKYGENIAMLLCTESDGELEALKKEAEKYQDLFSEKGKIGSLLSTYSNSIDTDVAAMYQTCSNILSDVKKGNSNPALFSRSYDALEKAFDKQTWFSNTGSMILDVQKGVSDAVPILDMASKVAEILQYGQEFQNQDEYSINALEYFLKASNDNTITSETVKNSMREYSEKLKSNVVKYSASKYYKKHIGEWIGNIVKDGLGSQANMALIAWDLVSSHVPFISDKLSAADSFELALYSGILQADAYLNYLKFSNETLLSGNVEVEKIYDLSKYCYILLKSCYITRNAATASLSGKREAVQEQLQSLIDSQNKKNSEIAEMLVTLKSAKDNNDKFEYGFLPDNNKKYLKEYNDKNIISIVKEQIEISSYFEQYTQLVEKLGMQITEPWQFSGSDSYMKDQFYLEWLDTAFSMKNEGVSYIKLYGIGLGESSSQIEKALKDNGWVKYSSSDTECTYLAFLNNVIYMVAIQKDDNGNVKSWYLNNWPEGEGISIAVELLKSDQYPDEEWKREYISYIQKQGHLSSYIYKLIDINGDEIPELYYDSGTIAGGAAVCSYLNDSFSEVVIYVSGLQYIEGKNIFRDTGGHMDRYHDKIYSIENEEFKLLYEGEYGAENNSNIQLDENGAPIYKYYWNGSEVASEAEYTQLLDEVFDVNQGVSPFDNAEYDGELGRYVGNGLCGYEEIINEILQY